MNGHAEISDMTDSETVFVSSSSTNEVPLLDVMLLSYYSTDVRAICLFEQTSGVFAFVVCL